MVDMAEEEKREETPKSERRRELSQLEVAALIADQLGETEELYRRALEISEQALGERHPETVSTLHGLASLYQAQRKYSEAEGLYRRALEISEQAQREALQAKSQDVATS